MKNRYALVALTSIVTFLAALLIFIVISRDNESKKIKVGFIHIGDASSAYTNNFYFAQKELENALTGNVTTVSKFNVEENEKATSTACDELIKEGCNIIFATSYGYSKTVKRFAEAHPDVQFCQATGTNANEEPVLPNYHTFMGWIYEGRYISGVVAGLKLEELINKGIIAKDEKGEVKIGYVAAFPMAEVISGYTAFFLGVRAIVPDAVMRVVYTNTWSNSFVEKNCAERLIEEGCVIISQHSDTMGPAIACEEASSLRGKTVFHVGYNQSMKDVAPTTSLVSCRINWSPYIISACEAVLKDKPIESVVKATINGNDAGSGIKNNWVEIIGQNEIKMAAGTTQRIQEEIEKFKNGRESIFQGEYIGMNPNAKPNSWNLRTPYEENANRSAPSFSYVLKDVIIIE